MLGDRLTKAPLVILFFMHVRWSTRLTWVVVASGFFWLLILFGLTMTDYMTRGWVEGTLEVDAMSDVECPRFNGWTLTSSALHIARCSAVAAAIRRLQTAVHRPARPAARVRRRIVYTEADSRLSTRLTPFSAFSVDTSFVMTDLTNDLAALAHSSRSDRGGGRGASGLVGIWCCSSLVAAAGGGWFWSTAPAGGAGEGCGRSRREAGGEPRRRRRAERVGLRRRRGGGRRSRRR